MSSPRISHLGHIGYRLGIMDVINMMIAVRYIDGSSLQIIAVVIICTTVIGGYFLYTITPYDEPRVLRGTITKMFMEPGDDGRWGFDSDGDSVWISGTSDEFFLVLNREHLLYINKKTYIGYNVGDEVEITQLSPSSYTIKLIG